jgi:hypothetical protein
LAVLGFELRVWCLLDRCPYQLSLLLSLDPSFLDRSHYIVLAQAGLELTIFPQFPEH